MKFEFGSLKGFAMVIKELYLRGYKRFFLNNIEELYFNPVSKVQLILGSNGSGKSSLLSMLNPLPPDFKKDFKQGGGKTIDILHNNNVYRLASTQNHHSFICNNIELNKGNTKRTQTELVYEHFKLDNSVMGILLDHEKFCDMNSAIRRSWLTKACKSDFTYAISVYNSIKSDHRDKIGAMKLLNDEISKSKDKILEDTEIEQLRKEKKNINELIEYLLSCLDTSIENNSNIKDQVNALNQYNKEMNSLFPISITKEEVANRLASSAIKEKEINSSIEKLDIEIINLKKRSVIKSDLTTLNKDLEEVNNKIKFIEDEINSYGFSMGRYNVESVYNNFNELTTPVINLLNQFEEFKDEDVSSNKTKAVNEEMETTNKEIKVLNYKINLLESDIEHMNKLKDDSNLVVCEKCGYKFYNKYDENTLIKYKKDLEELNKEKNVKEEKYNNLVKKINTINAANSIIRDLKDLISNNDSFMVYKYIITEFMKDSISTTISNVNKFSSLLSTWKDLAKLHTLKDSLTDSIKTLTSSEAIKKDIIDKTIEEKEKEVTEYIKRRSELNGEIKELNTQLDTLIRIETLNNKITSILKDVYDYKRNSIVLIRNDLIKSLIKDLKDYYVSVDSKITNHEFFSKKMKKDQETLDKITKEETLLNNLLKSLSPNDGLISKNIGAFLDIIIAEMNELINSVWSYSMVINNVNFIEGEEITYKFNVLVDNKELIEDVSKLSSSMKEIINLAFKITLMKYLGLTSIPLYMDEFGSTMDDVHRDTAYNIIDKTLSMDFEQIFIISHYESSYGRFVNSDITVLDSNNLLLSKDLLVNKRLRIL